MSDLDPAFDSGLDPSDFIMRNRRRVMGEAMTSLDADPDKAARSMELSKATGDPAPIINANLENYETQHKAALTSQLLNSSKYLREYIDADAMHSKVSNDDYAQLDDAGEKMAKLHDATPLQKWLKSDSIAKEFMEGMGDESLGMSAFKRPEDIDFALSHPFLASVLTLPTLAAEAMGRPISGILNVIASETGNRDIPAMLEYLMMRGDIGVKHGGGGPKFVNEALAKQVHEALPVMTPHLQAGDIPPRGIHPIIDRIHDEQDSYDQKNLKEAERAVDATATKERSPDSIEAFSKIVGDRDFGITPDAIRKLYGDEIPHPEDGKLGMVPDLAAKLAAAEESGADVRIPMSDWFAHVEPEVRDALRDDIRFRESGITKNEKVAETERKAELEKGPKEAKSLDDRLDALANERAALSTEEHNGIPNAKVHSDNVPLHDALSTASLPGWSHERSMAAAKWAMENGREDIAQAILDRAQKRADAPVDRPGVPEDSPRYAGIAENLKKIREQDKRDADELRESIKGKTEGEGKKADTGPLPEPLQIERANAGLEPLFAQGDRKLVLAKQARNRQPWDSPGEASHDFLLHNEDGNPVGYINLTEQRGGKDIHIDMIAGIHGHNANSFGPALTRDIFRQLKEEFPNLERIGGYRVSGARYKAGHMDEVWIKFADLQGPEGWTHIEALRDILSAQAVETPHSVLHYNPKLAPEAAKLDTIIRDTLGRIAPGAEVFTPDAITSRNKSDIQRLGFMQAHHKTNPWIVVALDDSMGTSPVGIARHEAIHFLKQFGFYSPAEWDVLAKAARENDWLKKYGIDTRYPELDMPRKLEEAVAEGYRNWADGKEVPKSVHPLFERLKELFEALRDQLKELLGHEPTWSELFEKTEAGEVGKREPRGHEKGAHLDASFSDQPELPGVTRMEDLAPFERDAITAKSRHDRYMKLIEKRHLEDIEKAQQRISEDQRKRQTKEWKENRAILRKEVDLDIRDRPDVAADLFFGAKELYGEKIAKTKLDAAKLTEEQKASLPKDYYGKDGIHPDDAARLFGYDTGDRMVNRLAAYNEVKLQAGMNAKNFLQRVIDIETDRQMEIRYGDLAKNILEDTREQLLSETQLNILHEETYRLATEAGLEFTLTKNEMKAAVLEKFRQLPVGEASSKEFLRASGKFGRMAEDALLKGDALEAFKAKQVQTYSNIYAAEAVKLEKAQKQLDRTAKTFRKAKVESVEPEYQNHIQDLLQKAGYKIRRTEENIAENIASKEAKTIGEFVDQKLKESYGYREIPAADFLSDPNFRKPIKEMTVDEFRQFKNTIDALVRNGRDEQTITREGETFEKAIIKDQMIKQVESFPLRTYKATKGVVQKALDYPRAFFVGSTNMETIFNRFDRDDPRGVFNQHIVYPLAKAANYESALQREISKPYRDLGPVKDKDKLVSAPFVDPLSITPSNPNGTPWQGFTRNNVMAMLQNAGNKSNWRVLAKGYGAEPEALMEWLVKNTTKEDWARAQKMGKTIFGDLIKKADREYELLNGFTIDKIPLEKIENEHGTFEGWYHPLIEDPIRKGKQKIRGGAFDDSDFGHASPANGYTKARSGAVYPLDLNFDSVPQRMKQMIHDIAFRRPVLDVQKIFKDPDFHNAVTKHYGDMYSDMMMPYLEAIAGAESVASKAGSKAASVSEYLRQNTISTYIGFNPYTALKHGPTAAIMSSREVGTVNFIKAVKSLYGQSPELGLKNSEFAMKWSEELQRRERHWQDTIVGQHKEIEGATTLRENIVEKGSWLVAQSDMLSAKPTWLARYSSAIEEGSSHGEAIDLADRAVRRAHGSTAVTNQPALVRGGGPLHGWLTSVYGFFGTAMQRRIEIAHQVNDMYQLGKQKEIKAAAAQVPGLTADIFTYVIWPTLVEEWVTGLTTDDRRGLGTHIVAGTFMGLSSSVLYLRDLAHAFVTGHDPGVGLLSSPLHDVANLVRDIKGGKESMSKAKAGKTIGDALTVFGEGTGMAPKTIANSVHFGIDLVNGQSHPKTFEDWRMGLTRGKTEKRIER